MNQNGSFDPDFENNRSSLNQNSPISPQPNSDIYQRINSLLDSDRDRQSPQEHDSLSSVTDPFHLDYPRGPLVDNAPLPQSPVGFGRRQFQASTPIDPRSSLYHYRSEDDIASPLKPFQRSFDVGYHSMPNSPMVPRRQQSLTKYSDCGSPSTDNSALTGSTRSLSPSESTASSCVNDNGISDLMNNYIHMLGGASPELLHPLALSQLQLQQYLQQQQNLQASLLSLLKKKSAGLNKSLPNFFGNSTTSVLNDGNGNSLERAAKFHRNAAANCDHATYTWSGQLPVRSEKNAVYSCKVFLGGVPWDLSEQALEQVFRQFGQIRVEWPGKEQQDPQPKGFAYIIFDTEKQVKALLASCCKDYANGGSWFYKISSRRMKAKEVQVIPWIISDCNYAKTSCQKLDPQKTVFVGALHGMITAEGLAKIMNDLFDGVIYAGIDTDKFKYPIGSARVTFSNTKSYMKAVAAAFIEIKTTKFSKKIQVDPYLEDALCSACNVQQGPYFCREMVCFRYFCRTCWQWHHNVDSMKSHKPLMRNSKNSPVLGFNNVSTPNLRFDN